MSNLKKWTDELKELAKFSHNQCPCFDVSSASVAITGVEEKINEVFN